jgi:hypothetical protein
MDIPDPVVTIRQIVVSCVPGNRNFSLFVEFRNRRAGIDWYSVTNGWATYSGGARTLDRNGKWADEHKPTSHSPSWRKARQFELQEAIEIAKKYAPDVTVNGYTVADGIREQAEHEEIDRKWAARRQAAKEATHA